MVDSTPSLPQLHAHARLLSAHVEPKRCLPPLALNDQTEENFKTLFNCLVCVNASRMRQS